MYFDVLSQENNFGTSKLEGFFKIFWLGLKSSTLTLISPWTMLLEGAVPPLNSSEVPPAPARDSSIPMAMVNKAQEALLGLQLENPVMNLAGPESLGLVQFSKHKSLWLNQRTSKQSLIYLFSFPLTTFTNSPRLTFFHIQFFRCTFVLQLRQLGAGAQSRGEGARHIGIAACSQPGPPCCHWQRDAMPCHLPPYLEGRYEWSCAGAPSHFQQRAAGWAQLSVRVWHCLASFQAVTVWHNDMHDHMENHNF